ncbi:restriction endonuclease subunit S [Zobellia uliginosa]|uniref:restriction endonuclease subunit S n=1 Tax=Zobellia uliginosa TaxID=143224 RepID=UPI0026E17369|nr:restriction endonuclease subunit S [Zobellia uliginosa]MDO6516104.1 restriction endonuclease subunit S [Zobellia uliginosa]
MENKKWTSKRLGSLCEILLGRTPSRSNSNYWGKGTSWVSISDLKEKYIGDTKEEITVLGAKESRSRLIPKGTLLMSFKLSVGKLAFTKKELYTNEAIAALPIKNPSELNKYFLYYALKNIPLIGGNQAVMGQTLNKTSLTNLKLPYPKSLDDQKRIAQVLTDCEELIAKRKESIALLDELLKSTFLEMFGDPVKNEKGWDWDTLENIVAEDCPLTYGIVQPGEEFSNGVPVVRPVDLKNDFVNLEGLKLINPLISEKFKRTKLNGGEILLVVRGTTGGVSIAGEELKGANVTRGITPIWLAENLNNRFVLHLIKSTPFQNLIKEKTYGIALKQINLRDVRVLPIIKPPEKLQKTFTDIADKVEETKKLYQKHLDELENLYGRLSQDAFKGELDLSKVAIRKEFEK